MKASDFALGRRMRSIISEVAFKLGRRTAILSANRLCLRLMQKNWLDNEYFDKQWTGRIKAMARHVPTNASVIDVGCGPMWLKELRPDLSYTGVDYVFRGPGSIVANFNRKQFPSGRYDVAFVSGCLEYVEDPEWFIAQISASAKRCVISYCVVEINDNLADRRHAAWVNDLSTTQIECLFRDRGFSLSAQDGYSNNRIFVFDEPAGRGTDTYNA